MKVWNKMNWNYESYFQINETIRNEFEKVKELDSHSLSPGGHWSLWMLDLQSISLFSFIHWREECVHLSRRNCMDSSISIVHSVCYLVISSISNLLFFSSILVHGLFSEYVLVLLSNTQYLFTISFFILQRCLDL
jgi:hypothetical protein